MTLVERLKQYANGSGFYVQIERDMCGEIATEIERLEKKLATANSYFGSSVRGAQQRRIELQQAEIESLKAQQEEIESLKIKNILLAQAQPIVDSPNDRDIIEVLEERIKR